MEFVWVHNLIHTAGLAFTNIFSLSKGKVEIHLFDSKSQELHKIYEPRVLAYQGL